MEDTIFKILALVGGFGVVLIGMATIIGYILRDYLKEKFRRGTEFSIEQFRHQLGINRFRADKYYSSQFEEYLYLWKSLQELKRTGEALWKKAKAPTLEIFARQLRSTKKRVDDAAFFFEERDYDELRLLLDEFGKYEIGKKKIIEIRSIADVDEWAVDQVNRQIVDNQRHKKQYEHLLDNIRSSFRQKLSALDED